jgi:hypothetical protein
VVRPSQSPSTADLHWTAGFIEGEGCFLFQRSFRVTANQVCVDPLVRLQRLYGGSLRPSKDGAIHTWAVNGTMGAGLAMTLYGLMSSKRKQQIAKALSKWKDRPTHQKYRHVCKRGHPFETRAIKKDGTAWGLRSDTKPANEKRRRWRRCLACRRQGDRDARTRDRVRRDG